MCMFMGFKYPGFDRNLSRILHPIKMQGHDIKKNATKVEEEATKVKDILERVIQLELEQKPIFE